MKQIILDTSFILSCIKKKIDFFQDRTLIGLEIVIPEQVLKELKGLGAELALNMIKNSSFTPAKAPGKDADAAIVVLAKKNPDAVIATLDAGLKKKLSNHTLRIRGEKQLEIV